MDLNHDIKQGLFGLYTIRSEHASRLPAPDQNKVHSQHDNRDMSDRAHKMPTHKRAFRTHTPRRNRRPVGSLIFDAHGIVTT